MNPPFVVEELVPHKGLMSLLSSVEACDERSLHARARVEASNPFLIDDSISSWLGIEYMAQAIAAWAGVVAQLRGEPVKVGLLVGTRRYRADTPRLRLGSELNIYISLILQAENGLGVFDCRIEHEEGAISASINVFVPDNIDAFLRDSDK